MGLCRAPLGGALHHTPNISALGLLLEARAQKNTFHPHPTPGSASRSWRKDTFFSGLSTLRLVISTPFKNGDSCPGGEGILERPKAFPSFHSHGKAELS